MAEGKKKRKRGKCAIYVNGNLVGFHADGAGLVQRMREKRRVNELNYETNVYYNERSNEIHINTDAGRVRKPYIVVEDGKSRLTAEMIKKVEAGQLSWDRVHAEIEILLNRKLKPVEAHAIGVDVQTKVERMKIVERAFVHIDYD